MNNETVNVAAFPMSMKDLKEEDRKNLRFFYTSGNFPQEAYGYTVGLLFVRGQFFNCYRPSLLYSYPIYKITGWV